MRRPLFPRTGRRIVTALCGYELIALHVRPLPPITTICKRWRSLAVLLVAVLAHHLLIEEG